MEKKNKDTLKKHPLYSIWYDMKRRCYNPTRKDYPYYGARGIKFCDRWLDINNFIEDMFPSYQEGLTLDRINVESNYEPSNIRWVSRSIQMRNTGDIRKDNISGFRGVSLQNKNTNKWRARIILDSKEIHLGLFKTALEAAKAYERYVRLNNLEHNFTPALTEEEIEEINKQKEINERK